ncbi:hypothetical protein Kpol_526p14 [Vanderwaltozyma polyspora DSM 70294]|uniref:Pyridoxamine 5'-phosphate oxidase Alr4036 family FMN-binding domain-containing protein n=1 Tax=Vanderwaltozyma polyspora (strain ATCC 22028 / DSM 70294 / BCRC 21397 / CBS 2163 / NBRC 10782 / NRRL Y-8283 / UCD 57-17) TaxID=436907 RepID=A7TLR9_VANPO|nr:uncharacterized protein Kpol_526p14 [Vanderwaltozyma polyspora DSM 70294]EDO16761.1 hypothetical protein Kpol_526p14 [Vanderwaltozyma polyspora DSM 70294]
MLIHQMAPWVPTFIQACKNNSQPFVPFQLATVDKINGNKPRCRTVVFRDFLFKDKNSNILTFNTDIRSDKIKESILCDELSGSTDFEACFYFHQTWEQFRFSGDCFILSQNELNRLPQEIIKKYGILSPKMCGHNLDELYKYDTNDEPNENGDENENESENYFEDNDVMIDSTEVLSDNSINTNGEIMVLEENPYATNKDWNLEIKRQWSLLSRSTRSQYRKPQPGEPITTETSKKLDKIQRGVDGTKENAGLENFAVVCLCIEEVDYLNLKGPSGAERWKYKRQIEKEYDGQYCFVWEEKEVCP